MSTIVFPTLPGLEWSVNRTPVFATEIKSGENLREVSAPLYKNGLYEYDMSYAFLREGPGFAELTEIQSLFLAMRGSYDDFLFTDPNDNSATDVQIGTGNGTNTTFILARNTGPSNFEAIGRLNSLTNIKVNNVVVDSSDYNFSAPNIIIFDTAPVNGEVVTATFTYYFVCRFNEDAHEYEEFCHKLYNLKNLTLRSVFV